MQALKLLLTLIAMIGPNAAIMTAMGWTNIAHFVALGGWTLVSTVLVVLIPDRHRRHELRKALAVAILVFWVALGAALFGTEWDIRTVLAALLVLPGLNYLLLETLQLTPRPVAGDRPLP